jgi:hypothetical protein
VQIAAALRGLTFHGPYAADAARVSKTAPGRNRPKSVPAGPLPSDAGPAWHAAGQWVERAQRDRQPALSARAWYRSDGYQEALGLRRRSSEG